MTDREAIDVLFNEWKCIDRNDGIHCDRKCESCDLVMDVGIIREAFNMAISALQAQDSPKPTAESAQNVPKEDLISRKAAIEAMSESLKRVFPGHRQIAEKCLKALPSAQPEPQWIPVSERLPEYGVAVLTYDGHCFCVEKRIPTIRDDEGEPITGDWWVSDDYDEYDGDYYPNLRDGACIAWMPLPEPYRAERRTDE